MKISVIIACYNGERWIDGCMQSLAEQTLKPDEIIVTDDGSTDKSGEKLVKWQKKLKNLKIVTQQNKGLSAARNSAMKAASGDIYSVLDIDDRWHPDKLEKHVKFMNNNPSVDVGFTDFNLVDEEGKLIKESGMSEHPLMWNQKWKKVNEDMYISEDYSIEWMVRDGYVHPSALMLRPSTISKFGNFNEKVMNGEDLEYFVRCFKKKAVFGFINKPLSKITMSNNSLCRGNLNSWKWRVRLMNMFEKKYSLTKEEKIGLRDAKRNYLMGLSFFLFKERKYLESREFAKQALRCKFDFGAVKYVIKTLPGIRGLFK